jgi:DNA (cytosine-5)-methyltransferase 1
VNAPRIGSLCSGYGGLDMAVEAVLGGELAWVSDIDKGACKLLAHRYPDVPNLGDFTVIDWATVEPIDIFTAGFPCQPVSHAGKQLGDNDERWLWDDVLNAIRTLRPGLVLVENVRGLLTNGRLFGRVHGSLAAIGYDTDWHCLRAADIGAPHNRFRVFIVAHPHSLGRDADRRSGTHGLRTTTQPATLLPTPRTSDTNGAGAHGDGGLDLRTAVSLLPTPTANDYKGSTSGRREIGEHRHQLDAVTEGMAQRLLPTPRDGDGEKGGPNQAGSSGDLMLPSAVQPARWGDYATAIARWEAITRPAPEATQPTGRAGTPRLAPAFSEWMMGLPAGWITDVPGVTRNEALKLAGNGVVPAQAAAALTIMLSRAQVAA